MALSDESRALLQLLLVRGKDYDQIGELLGASTDDVRSRAVAAVGELTDGEVELDSAVVDYMLGQADPIGRAEAVRILSDDPEQAACFRDVRDQLTLVFPGSGIPDGATTGSESSTRDSKSRVRPPEAVGAGLGTASSRWRVSEMDGKTRTILAALVAALALAAIVAVVALLGGGDAERDQIEPPPPTTAALRPPSGGPARGDVEFGFSGNRFAANVSLSNLPQSRDGEGYALWLEGPAGSFPFDSARVGPAGTISGQSEISQAIICFIAADLFTEVKVSSVSDVELRSALREAVDRNVRQAEFPSYVGETVLSGPISMPLESRERIIQVCGGRNSQPPAGTPGS